MITLLVLSNVEEDVLSESWKFNIVSQSHVTFYMVVKYKKIKSYPILQLLLRGKRFQNILKYKNSHKN